MSLKIVDRVKEATASDASGTGTISLNGAPAGFQTFVAGVGTGNTTYYAILDVDGVGWEVGIGTVTDSTPDTLSRTPLASSNGGSAVNLSTGAHTVFATYPASKAVYLDASGNLSASVNINDLTDVHASASADLNYSLFIGNNGFGSAPTLPTITSGVATGNIGIGVGTLTSLIDYGSYNVSLGHNAGSSITDGDGNVLLGAINVGTGITTGSYNIGLGSSALRYGATGIGNIAIGASAIKASSGSVLSGDYNTALGYHALQTIQTGDKNVGIGYYAGGDVAAGTTDSLFIGNDDTAADGTLIRGDFTHKMVAIGNTDDHFSTSSGAATLQVYALATDDVGLNIKMAASTTANAILVEASDGTDKFVVDKDGVITTGSIATATEATNITVSANNSTNETVYPVFVDGATGTQGAETDTGLTYNPSSGLLTAAAFSGPLTGNVTGNASGTAATVTGGTQAAITSAANLATIGTVTSGALSSGAVLAGVTVTMGSDAEGDIYYRNASGVLTRLAASTDGHVLTSTGAGSAPAWEVAASTLTQEQVEDYAGALVASGGTKTGIAVTYQDGTGDMDFVVDHDAASNFVANEHIDHSSVSIASGTGLSGGGDLTSTRTLSVDASQTQITAVGTIGTGVWQGTAVGASYVATLNQDTTGTAAIATTVTITDNENTDEDNAIVFTAGGDVDGGNLGLESDGTLTYNPSTGKVTATGFIGALTGNADTVTTNANLTGHITSTGNATVLGVFSSAQLAAAVTGETGTGGLVFATSPALVTPALGTPSALVGTNISGTAASLTAGTATVATTVTITDNESTNENNAIIFTAGGDLDGGNLGLESDGDLHYNPSTGTVTATVFAGALTGNVTGNASGTAATVTGAAQTAITSVGTLTALAVDNITIDGNTISSTAGTDLNITPLAGQQIVLDGAIVIDAGVVTGATSITSTAFVGNVTGNASGTAATVTGAAQTAITSLGTLTGLTVDSTGGIKVKNGSTSAGFIEFYEDSGNGTNKVTFIGPAATADVTITLPAVAGTVVTTGDTGSVSNDMLAGSIANGKLANSSVNYGGVTLSLGGSDTTPAFDLSDATSYPTSSLTGTITNAQLAGSIVNSKLSNSTITIDADVGTNNAVDLGDTLSILGTTNEIVTTVSGDTLTLSLPSNVTISGDLTVGGDTTTVNTATLSVEDPLIILASGNNSSDAVDIGFYGLYDTSGSLDLYAGLFRDANDSGKFKLFKDLQAVPTTAVDVAGTGYAVATLVADIEGALTGNADTVTNGVYTSNNLSVMAATTSAQLAGVISDETGSGALVFATSPTLVTPALGTPSALVGTNISGTAASLTAGAVTNGVYTTNNLSVMAATTSAQLAGVISNETGSGSLVFATSPTLVTPALGTPSALVGTNISGTAASLTVGKVTVSDSTADTAFPVAFHDESNALLDDTGAFTYNPNSSTVTATTFVGNLTGNASGTAATVTGAAQTAITSVGTLTALAVDNITIDGNTISSTAGTDLNITPLAGQQIVLDGAIVIDAGVVTGATSITSTAFVGNVTGNASGTAATVTGGTQASITSAANLVTVGALDAGSITSGFTSIDVGAGAITTTGAISGGTGSTFSSSLASEPVVHITNTHAGATSGELRFNKDSASGDDSDVMGLISFYGTDAAENTHERLAYIDAIITDSAHGSEASSLRFYVAENDATLTQGLLIAGQADDNGEVDVTIGAGAASTTTVAGTLTMGSTAALTNAGLVVVANQSGITGLGTIGTGTWAAVDVAVAHGGTGASSASAARTNLGAAPTAGSSSILTVGDLDSGSITSGFGSINNGSSAITTTGTITGGALTVDNISVNGNTISSTTGEINITPISGSAIVLDGTISIDAGAVTGATSITSTAFVGNITGDVTGNADTATVATSVTVSANNSTDETVYPVFVDGATGTQGAETDTGLTYNPNSGLLTAAAFSGPLTGNVTGNASGTAATVTGAAQTAITSVGTLTALQVDNINIDGNAITSTAGTDLTITPLAGQQIVLDGAIVVDAGVVTGATSITSTAFVGDITGDVTGNADTATLATSFTATANNSTDETVYPVFVDGATGTQGAETDTGLTYNPNSGLLTAAAFSGPLTGNVTGNTSGTAATVTGGTQASITSAANLATVGALNSGSITSGFGSINNGSSDITTTGTIAGGSLDIDDVVINGSTIGHTDDTDLITVASGALTVKGNISTFVASAASSITVGGPQAIGGGIHMGKAMVSYSITGTSHIFYCNLTNLFTATLGNSSTLATIAFASAEIGQKFIIRFVQDATGSRLVTWDSISSPIGDDATINWEGGTAPTLSTAPGAIDVLGFIVVSGHELQDYVLDGFVIAKNLRQ